MLIARGQVAIVASFILVVAATGASARPVTNNEIVQMIRAGLPEDVIVAAVREGGEAIDRSPAALISLKQAGASNAILQAVSAAGVVGSRPPEQGSDSSVSPQPMAGNGKAAMSMGMGGIGAMQRVFVVDNGARTELQADSSGYNLGFSSPFSGKVIVRFEGPRSNIRVHQGQPSFELALASSVPAAQTVMLVRLKVSDHRSIDLKNKGGLLGMRTPEPPAASRIATIARDISSEANLNLGIRIWSIQPAAQLPPGEYAILPGAMQSFSFGVD
jgi:hypothetical protein